jgi:photosystem II stability/assembly factor-like uncharacterized protein
VVGYQGAIYRTIDGGVTWEAEVSGTHEYLHGIEFPDPRTAIAVGDNGTICRSTDGGVTWQYQKYQGGANAFFYFNSIAFSSPSTGIIAGRMDSIVSPQLILQRTMILRTIDGGLNWVRAPASWPNELMSVCYGGISTVHAVGSGGLIIFSYDGGLSWIAQAGELDPESGKVPPPTTNLRGVSFAGPDVGVAVGESGMIRRTLNGGTTWTQPPNVTQSNLNGVWTVNGVHFLAVGMAGAVLISTDAGGSWIGQPTETSLDLFAVHFTDIDRGTIVGDRGIILRTLLASSLPSGVGEDKGSSVPETFSLSQNYPNPFNGVTNFEFHVARFGSVSLKVYDLLGREVATLCEGDKPPGIYRSRWETKNAASGVYFYRLIVSEGSGRAAQQFVATKKMILMK